MFSTHTLTIVLLKGGGGKEAGMVATVTLGLSGSVSSLNWIE